MRTPASLAARYARRPLLIEPAAAQALLRHIAAADPRGLPSEGRLEAFLRHLGVGRDRASAMEDDEAAGEVAPQRPAAYAPLWAQQTYGDPTDEGFAWCLFQGVATMEVDTALADRGEYYCGVWYHGYDTLLAGMREALADERVKALFVRMNSPGGPVSTGLPALAAFMRSARAAAGGKSIWVYGDMACSAAYWVSAQADRIVGGDVSLIGSIGAVLVHEDWSAALAKAGVAITPIQFGSEKTAGAWWEALSPSAKDDLQAEIDQCGRNFVADVALGRPQLTPEALIATQARVFLGKHDDASRSALDLGFLDAVMSEQDAFAELLASVTPRSSAPLTGISSAPAATGSRSAVASTQETPMATGQPQLRPTSAAALLSTTAVTPRPAATASNPDPEMEPAEPPEDEDETAGGAADAEGEGEGQDNKAKPESEVIAASPEAQANPTLALAAIQSGQTYAQFQANVAAMAGAPKASKLDVAMAGAHRLGPDGASATAAAPEFSASGIYARRAAAVGRAR